MAKGDEMDDKNLQDDKNKQNMPPEASGGSVSDGGSGLTLIKISEPTRHLRS